MSLSHVRMIAALRRVQRPIRRETPPTAGEAYHNVTAGRRQCQREAAGGTWIPCDKSATMTVQYSNGVAEPVRLALCDSCEGHVKFIVRHAEKWLFMESWRWRQVS